MSSSYEREMAIQRALVSEERLPIKLKCLGCDAQIEYEHRLLSASSLAVRPHAGLPICGGKCWARWLEEQRAKLPQFCGDCGEMFSMWKHRDGASEGVPLCDRCYCAAGPWAVENYHPYAWRRLKSDCCEKARWAKCVCERCTNCPDHGRVCKGSHE